MLFRSNMWYGKQRPNPNLVGEYDTWIDIDESTYVVNKDNCTTFLDESEPLNAILNDIWIGSE